MSTTPLWITVLAVVGSLGVGTLIGALVQRGITKRGQDLQRSTDLATDKARRRSEALVNMRWAAEKAVSSDPDVARLGEQVLYELQNSTLLLDEDGALLAAMYRAVLAPSLRPGSPPGDSGVP